MTNTDSNNKGSKGYLFSIVLVAVIGGLLFGYDTAVISGAEKGLQAFFMGASDFVYTDFMHGITSSSALIGCVIGAALWWRPVMYLAFDRDFAMGQGIATRSASYLLTAIVAITIVLAIRIMGIVLLLSLFTIPAVAANSLTKSYPRITLWAAIIATVGAVAGLVASYNWEVPPGTCIIFILTLVLIAAKLLSLHLKTRLNASENHT